MPDGQPRDDAPPASPLAPRPAPGPASPGRPRQAPEARTAHPPQARNTHPPQARHAAPPGRGPGESGPGESGPGASGPGADASLLLGAPPSRPRRRHWLLAASFVALVVLPTLASAVYLFAFAADRYGSRVAFSIRSSESSAPLEILGAVTQIGGGSMRTDGQVLYDFIQSQQIVETVARRLPLRAMWNRAPRDWLFSLGRNQPIENLVDYWNRMVDVSLDSGTGIVTVDVRAFRARDAQAIAAAILQASSALVNRLADIAREDAVHDAKRELTDAETRLRTIRAKLRKFRNAEQEIDPSANAKLAVDLVAQLEGELSQARVQLTILRSALDESAPRIGLLKRKIDSLKARIAAERKRLGTGTAGPRGDRRPLSAVVGDYEELVVDREFAERAYTMALATYQQAEAEARRRHRYLAAHIAPTLSQEAQYPDRPLLILAVFLLTLVGWSVLVLGGYGLRDRG